MNPFNWTPPTGVNDTSAFPSKDTNFRAHLQTLLDQAKDYVNNSVIAPFNGQLIASNGYQKLPNGLILQWGINNVATSGSTITLPIAFPNNFLAVFPVKNNHFNECTPSIGGSKTSFTMYVSSTGGSYMWFAIGN